MFELSQADVLRYTRQLPLVGVAGQLKIKQASILCVGAGGLACAALPYLASAGVGVIGVVDADVVDVSNLQRQILFTEEDVGKNKALVATKKLAALNSLIQLDCYQENVVDENAQSLFEKYDIIIDATDNFKSRYLINRVCRKLKKPLVSASVYQFDAQISVFNYKNGPCYECLYPAPPPAGMIPNCVLGGVLGVLPGVAGNLQANEVLKIILGEGEVLSGKLLAVDLRTMRFRHFSISKKESCCHDKCSVVQASKEKPMNVIDELSPSQLKQVLESVFVLDVREPFEREICNIGGTHIPLGQLANHLSGISRTQPIVIYCKSGVRSVTAARLLLSHGFDQVKSLRGGIIAWIDQVDSSLFRY